MHKGRLAAVGLLGMTALLAMPGAQAASTNERAEMTGKEEVPGPGAANAKGTADIVIDDAANTLCYTLTFEGIDKPTTAHVHSGAAGQSGPVAIDLQLDPAKPKSCVKGDAATLAGIRDKPGDFYVNIHTAEYPKGAVRGQLAKK